jgi:predicted nucleic acid-binding protein
MTAVLVDTSAVVALLVPTDSAHRRARAAFHRLAGEQAHLLVTSYTLVECYGLIGRRLGKDAVRAFRADFAPLLDVIWVDLDRHERGLDLLVDFKARGLSLVDAVSFVAAHDLMIDRVFAYDRHFTEAGFEIV